MHISFAEKIDFLKQETRGDWEIDGASWFGKYDIMVAGGAGAGRCDSVLRESRCLIARFERTGRGTVVVVVGSPREFLFSKRIRYVI
jgi:hypothetical protein